MNDPKTLAKLLRAIAGGENAKAARSRHPTMSEQNIQWTIGCLTAKEIT